MIIINRKKYLFFTLLILTFAVIFIKNIKSENTITPLNLNNTHICANDSMIIIDYKGPKAQIIWNNKSHSYYCEVREAFYESTNTITQKNIKYFFVQDFSNVSWDSYIDKWILANKAYYVIDSDMDGAMGITYVPFSDINAARTFLNDHGGKLLHYSEINNTVLKNTGLLLKNRVIS